MIERHFDSSSPRTKPRTGDSAFIDAVLYRAKPEVPWRDLSEGFGPRKSGENRFSNWSKAWIWELLFAAISIEVEVEDLENEEASIADASIVKDHQDSVGQKRRRKKCSGWRGISIHAKTTVHGKGSRDCADTLRAGPLHRRGSANCRMDGFSMN